MEVDEDHDRALPGYDEEPGTRERALRLKEAVRQAGGPLAVAQASGIPKGTIFSYQRGRDMKVGGLVRLAEATGVRLEWLATGQGPMRPGEAPSAPAAPPTPPAPAPAAEPFRVFGKVKIDRLEQAWNAAVAGAQGNKRLALHLMLVLYDELSADSERTEKAHETSG